jgi:hypothetical protein
MFTTIFDDLYTRVGTTWQLVGASGLSVTDVSGLAFVNGQLFGYATDGAGADSLVRYSAATGAASVVGATGVESFDALAGLTFDSFATATLFATDGDRLLSINTTSGAASVIGAHNVAGFVGIAAIPAPGALLALGLAGAVAARRRRA